MAFILKDRVKENSTTTGTGNISLGGASATFDAFQSYLTNGDTTYYAIAHTSSGVDEWEVGLGTWNTGNTLSRTTILAGSNGTSAVNFSAGTKDIFMTYPASKAAVAGEDVTFADITVTGTVDGRDVAADGSKLDGIDTSADVTDATTVAAAGALMRSGGTMTGNLILNADPNAALGAATKQYVDTIASAGIHYHAPVRAEHPSNLNATYNNGSSGVGATLTNAGTNAALVIDSVSMVLNDRVLVANQTNQTQNGVYTVTTVGNGSTAWVLTRSTDTDTAAPSDPDAFGKGDAFFIKEGSTNAGHLDVLSTAGTIVFGTTNIVFSEVAETTVYSSGTGITLTGTTFSIGQDVATSANVTFNQVTAAIIGNVTGNLTGDVTGNADTATALETARTIQLSGDVTGSASFDGSANINITAAVQDDSHAHVISNVDGLQTALNAKVPTSRTITAGNGLTGGGDLTANRTLTVGSGTGITVNANDIAIDSSYTGFDSRYVNAAGDTITSGTSTGLTINHDTFANGLVLHRNNSTLAASLTFKNNTSQTGILFANHSDQQPKWRKGTDTTHYSIFNDSYHPNADKWTTARTLSLSGDASGSVSWDGSSNVTLSVSVGDADTVDGVHGSSFLRSDANDTYTGLLSLGNTSSRLDGSDGFPLVQVNSSRAYFGSTSRSKTVLASSSNTGAKAVVSGTEYSIFHDNYHPNADKWTTARTLSLSGDASGSVSWDGSANATLSVTVANDSHTHNKIIATDDRDMKPSTSGITSGVKAIRPFFSTFGGMTGTSNSTYLDVLAFDTYSDSSGGGPSAITFHKGASNGSPIMYIWKAGFGATTWGTGQRVFADNYHPNADAWTTSRTLSLTGDATGSVSIDGSANVSLSVSVGDADTVDGVHGSSFLRSDANDTYTGVITGNQLHVGGGQITSSVAKLQVKGFQRTGTIYLHEGQSAGTNNYPLETVGSELRWNSSKVWNAGNDGSGSGLDADTVDGIHASSIFYDKGVMQLTTSSSWDVTTPGMYGVGSSSAFSGTNNPSSAISGIYTYGVLSVFEANGNGIAQLYTPHTGNKIAIRTGWNNAGWYPWQQVWTSTSDGSGSGLDADLLDGVQGNKYFTSYNNAGTTGWEDSNSNFRINSGGSAVGFAMHESDGTFGFNLYGDGTFYGFLDANWGGWDIRKSINGAFQVDEGSGLQRVFNDAYHPNADKWTTARTLSLSGDASGSVSWDGSANATLSVAVSNDSHTHDGRYYTETEADGRFAKGQISIGSVDANNLTVQGFYGNSNASSNQPLDNNAGTIIHMRGSDGNYKTQLFSYSTNALWQRGKHGSSASWSGWSRVFMDNYHPNADAWTTSRTLTLSGDASGSVSIDGSSNVTLSVAVANDSHNHDHSDGDFTVNGGNLYTGTSQQRVKLSVWDDTTYGIGMKSGYTFGGLNSNYAMSFQMNDDTARGFWWGDSTHTDAQGAMALTTDGVLNVANNIAVGYGESDTARRTTYALDVSGTARVTTDLYVGNKIIHDGDTDTVVRFFDNEISLQAQGSEGARIKYGKITSPNVYVSGTNAGDTQVLTSSAGSVQLRNIASLDSTTTSTIQAVAGGGATGGGSDEVFYENGQTVTTNYTITNNKNAMSAGPITINSGVTVTVGSGETWTVV